MANADNRLDCGFHSEDITSCSTLCCGYFPWLFILFSWRFGLVINVSFQEHILIYSTYKSTKSACYTHMFLQKRRLSLHRPSIFIKKVIIVIECFHLLKCKLHVSIFSTGFN